MKIVILGSNGQLGQKLTHQLSGKFNVFAFNKKKLDITKLDKVSKIIKSINPNIIINASAYTAVDKAEDEKNLAYTINGVAVKNIAKIAKELDSFLIHYSTDYVFDGKKKTSYIEKDLPNPLNIYGKSKLKGENEISKVDSKYYIFRLTWVISEYGSNFLNTILSLSLKKNELKVINDQFGVPTSVELVSKVTENLINSIHQNNSWPYGVYNLAPRGKTTWYKIATDFLKFAKKKGLPLKIDPKKIIPIVSDKFPLKAVRPKNSLLNTRKLRKVINFDLQYWDNDFKHISKKIINKYKSKCIEKV